MKTGRMPDASSGPLGSRPSGSQKLQEKATPQKWVQCTICKQWRQVPYHLKDSDLGDRWECSENIWDPMYASCNVRQALSDEQIDAILESCQEIEEQGETRRHRVHEFHSHELRLRRTQYRSRHHDAAHVVQEGPELSDVAEALLRLGEDGDTPRPGTSYPKNAASSLVPGRLIWGKVEGHDWWPAKVVRRRSVPVEVGPPPGGAAEVMFYTPVVFFTPNGVPREVELSMDCEEFPITICQRACGWIDEDEAEYAWLSADNIRLFSHGDTSGRKDGTLVDDEQLQGCILAAQNDLAISETQAKSWRDDEDSDGGWGCAAEFHRNRHQKHKKATRRKSKRLDDAGSDMDSGPDEGPELIPYGTFRLAPKIAVEHIYAWRRPLTREEKAKEMEQENIDNAINLRKLAYLEEVLKKGETLSVTMFDSFDLHEHSSELQLAPSMALLDDSALKAQERAAVSTLLGLGPLSQIDSEPVLSSLEEAEYFVKYANRSHLHNEWVKESTLMTFAKRKLTQFKRRYCDEPIDMFNKEWAKPERIISRRKCRTGPGWELLVKWFDLGYEYCTWESENARILSTPEAVLLYIDLWRRQMNAMHKKSKRALELFHQTRKQQFATYKPLDGTPGWLRGSQLHSHQLEVLNWMRSMWLQEKGGFVIGDLGQGRTAVMAAFLQCLRQEMNCVHPFLVVVPGSRISKCDGEIDFWTGGEMVTVQYQGPASARPVCLEHEIWQSMECMDGRYPWRETTKIPKPDVVLVSSEILPVEIENLLEIPWDLAILDTRMLAKGGAARLASALAQTRCPHFVIANEMPSSETGLTNTLRLVDTRQNVMPHSVKVCMIGVQRLLESQDSNEESDREEHAVEQLQMLLKKHLFQVGMPVRPLSQQAFKEIFIPLEFKPEQRAQYKESLVKYYDFLKDEGLHRFSAQNVGTLKHIAEELSLICQHPILADENEDFDGVTLSHMIGQSAKLEALDVLLRELKESAMNALLLTQSQKTLSLLMKFVTDRFGPSSVECVSPADSTSMQHAALARFESGSFCFLLTTGDCCGLGMKLDKISCAIVLESALKSDADLLALSRAYQIGMRNALPVFRFFLAGTVEERMLQLIKMSDLHFTSLSKGNSYDMKVFEDVLIWGTKGLFETDQDLRGHPFSPASIQKATPCTFTEATCKMLLHAVFNSSEGQPGYLGGELSSIKWTIKRKDQLSHEYEPIELMEMVRHATDPLLMAGYWEQLLRHEWNEKRQQEDARERAKRLATQRERYDMMDCDRDGSENGDNVKEHKRKTVHRRKRLPQEHETLTNKGQKKQKSLSQKLESMMLTQMDDGPNDENKWTKEALLSCKAHQDVLTQILADPNTVEGKTAQEAFFRIDTIAKELSLPKNIVMMANQVAEILLTMKEDQDSGSHFHDYTILVIIAFAAFLGGVNLGEGCGLTALAIKYHQDLDVMEKLFTYVTKLILEYKQMLIKINQLIQNKGNIMEEKKGPVGGHEGSGSSEVGHGLHRELDAFLRYVSDAMKKDRDAESEKLADILEQPPGAPIKGHTPVPWFPFGAPPESSLTKQARLCDAQTYLIEKLHENKFKSIEKAFQSFQERVREYGVKALEKVSYETMLSRSEVDGKKQQLKDDVRAISHRAESASATSYNNLLAQMQLAHQWQHAQEQEHIHSAKRGTSLMGRGMHRPGRESGPSYFPLNPASHNPMQQSTFGVSRPQSVSVEWLMTVNNGGQRAMPPFHKAQELTGPQERKNLTKASSSMPKMIQYTPLHGSTMKPTRAAFHSVKLPHVGLQRQPDDAVLQHGPRLQTFNVGQVQHPMFVSNMPTVTQPVQTMPFQIPGTLGLFSSMMPNFSNLCVLPRHAVTGLTVQQTESGTGHSAAPVQMPPASWSSVPWLQQTALLEQPPFASGRPKPHQILETPPVRVEHAQPVKVVLSTAPTTLTFSDWLPVGTMEMPSRSLDDVDEQDPHLERASSIPSGNATITTGTGKDTAAQIVRQGSLPEFHMRAPWMGTSSEFPHGSFAPLPESRQGRTAKAMKDAQGALDVGMSNPSQMLEAQFLKNYLPRMEPVIAREAPRVPYVQSTETAQAQTQTASGPGLMVHWPGQMAVRTGEPMLGFQGKEDQEKTRVPQNVMSHNLTLAQDVVLNETTVPEALEQIPASQPAE